MVARVYNNGGNSVWQSLSTLWQPGGWEADGGISLDNSLQRQRPKNKLPHVSVTSNDGVVKLKSNQYFHEVRVLRTQSPLKSPTSWHYHNGTAFSTEPCWGCFVFKPEQSIICVPTSCLTACLSVCQSSIYPSHHPSIHLPVCIVFLLLPNWWMLSSARNSLQLWAAS